MRTTIGRTWDIPAAHRLPGHAGKCRHLHGHTYRVSVELAACTLDGEGMVADYGVLDGLFGDWLRREWDHGLLLGSFDPCAPSVTETMEGVGACRTYVVEGPPTCEVLAMHLLLEVFPRLLAGAVGVGNIRADVELESVTVAEGDRTWARVER